MLKQGQLSLFFVIGVVILVIYLLATAVNSNSFQRIPTISSTSEIAPVQLFVESCLKQTLEEALIFTGLQGGYYNPLSFEPYSSFKIPYYFQSRKVILPTLNTIEGEIAQYINNNLDSCINNFDQFRALGYSIMANTPLTTIQIQDQKITASLDYSVDVTQGRSVVEMEAFRTELDFNFKEIYSLIEKVMIEQNIDFEYVPLGFLMDSAEQNNFTYELIYLDDSTIVFSFIFENKRIKKNPYIFNYVAKYDWDSTLNFQDAKISEIPKLTAYTNKEFYYKVEPSKDGLFFIDYTDLFDINILTGEIKFIPSIKDLGNHHIVIQAEDPFKNLDSKIMELTIVENE